VYANTVYTADPVYSRHFVASRINALAAVVVAVVFTLDHIVTTQTTMGWTKSLQYRMRECKGVNSHCDESHYAPVSFAFSERF